MDLSLFRAGGKSRRYVRECGAAGLWCALCVAKARCFVSRHGLLRAGVCPISLQTRAAVALVSIPGRLAKVMIITVNERYQKKCIIGRVVARKRAPYLVSVGGSQVDGCFVWQSHGERLL